MTFQEAQALIDLERKYRGLVTRSALRAAAAARHTRLAAHYAHMVLSHLEAISQQQIVRGADDESR